nr:oligosaccharide flippase family protein [Roseibacterium elongatum]
MPLSHTLGPFCRNLLAYGVSEGAAKASRLLVVIAVARSMDVAALGVAAAAMAASDILKALTENGVGHRIIATSDADLPAACRTARRIFWVWCLGLVAVQVAIGAAVILISGQVMLGALIALLALEYLFMPAGLVQAALAMRAGKLRQTATIAGAQVVGANALTAALVLVWPSPLALVLPRVLSAPIWLIAMRRLHPWRVDRAVPPAPVSGFVRFGAGVLGVEIVRAVRMQADKLIVGWILGAEALGLYFMAFNAGLGLANSFALAFSTVLFPHLCQARDRPTALRQSLVLALGLIAPVVVLQSLMAPIYVPILFGPGWEDASGIVSVLCLAAIPGIIWSSAAGWLRAEARTGAEFTATTAMAAALIVNTIVMAPFGLMHIAIGYLVVAAVTQVAAAWPALSVAFLSRSPAKV